MRNFFFILFFLALNKINFSQAPEVVVQLAHGKLITSMAKHPDKSWVATGAADNKIKVWDYNMQKLVTTLIGHKDAIECMMFMPGSDRYLLSTTKEDQNIILWDVVTGEKVKVYKHPRGAFWSEGIGFTAPDANGKPGKYFYAGHQFGIEKWETMTGKLIEQLDMDTIINDGKHHWVHNFVYLPDQDCSFFTDGTIIYKYDHSKRSLTKEFTSGSSISTLDYNKAQNILAVAANDHFYIVDIKTHAAVYTNEKVGNYYEHTASLSDNGELLFLNEESNFAHIIRWKDKKDLIWFKGGQNFDNALFADNSRYVILAGNKGYPFMYNVFTLEARPFNAIDNGVKALTLFNNDRYILKAGNENVGRIFDLQTADYIGSLEGHEGLTWYSTCSKSGKYLATSSADQTIKIWDPVTLKCITTIRSPYPLTDLFSSGIGSVAFKKIIITDDDKYVISFLQGNSASGKKNGYVWKWDLQTGKLVDEFHNNVKRLAINAWHSVSDIAINPAKDELIVCSYNNLILLRASDFKMKKKNIDPESTWFSDVEYSDDGKMLLVNRGQGSLDFWDTEKWVKLKSGLSVPPTYIFTTSFNPDGSLLAAAGGFDDNRVFIIDTKTFKIIKEMEGHNSWVMALTWSKDGKKLFSGSEDSKLILWDTDSLRAKVTLVNNANSEDYVFYNDAGYYKITRSGFKSVAFRSGSMLFPFEQFDVKFNRPDLILRSLESENTELIELYHRAYEKRLKSLGLNESGIMRSFYIPQIKTPTLPYTTASNEIKVMVNASDSVYKLKSLVIRVNEIPVFGKTGIDLSKENLHVFEKEFTIPLSTEKNRIEISCINEQGAESMRSISDVTTSYEFPKPELYLIVMSVSHYKDTVWNLKYAAKDGKDIGQLFSKGFPKNVKDDSKDNYFKTWHGGGCFDTCATRAKFLELKKALANSKPQDHVIIFFSGHGLLDKKFDFYYATYDCDFNDPAAKGLSFADIEAVLDASPAHNKLLFIDACHSGDVDKEAIEVSKDSMSVAGTKGVVTYKTKGSQLVENQSGLSLTNSFNLMKEIFTSSERGTGTIIISAAAGDSYALESDAWNNGIFTYAIINGVKNNEADVNQDKQITVTELKNYLIKEVYSKTGGRQKPTCRKENLEYDFRVK